LCLTAIRRGSCFCIRMEPAADALACKAEALAQFWDTLGERLIAPHLDTLSLMRLSEAATTLRVVVLRQIPKKWLIALEVTPLLRSSAAMRARSLCINNSDSRTPVADVHLLHKNLLSGLPQQLVNRASECTELTLDFEALTQFQKTCSHSSLLTGDPWEHVVLKLILDAGLLDRSLRAVRHVLQHVQVLKILNMPYLALLRKTIQDVDEYEEPLSFPVLRQLAGLRQLRVLALESARPHPDSIMVLSIGALKTLTDDVLPLLPLEELSISTVVVEPSHGARSSERPGMDLGPFLKLRHLKRLRLAAVRCCSESQLMMAKGPTVLDLRETCQLEHLDISFLADPGGSPGGVTVLGADTPASPSLRTLAMRNLGNSPSELRPQLGRYLSACQKLQHVLLSGLHLQVDFLEQVVQSLTTDEALSGARSSQWSLEWIQFSAPSNRETQLLNQAAAAFAQHGAQFQARVGVPMPADLRMTSETAASLEQQPTAGLSTFGEGMDWFLGGVVPAPLSVDQHAVINNRYG